MEQSNFYAAKSHLYEFFGIDIDNETFETIGMHAWDKINNKAYRFYRYRGLVKDLKLELPCNADIIEYVQGSAESSGTTNPVSDTAAYNTSANIEDWIENNKTAGSIYYGRGHYLDYTQSGTTLFFTRDNIWVNVLYKGIVLDEEGLPKINFKEQEAIAKYCAFVDLQKKAMITKDQSTMQLAIMMKQEWNQACGQARTPIYFSQNQMDKVLDVQASWDRKRFNKSFKILR